MLSKEQHDMLIDIIGKNLHKLMTAMEWKSQVKFAQKIGISTGALCYYLNDDVKKRRLPSIEFLVKLCTMPEFKEKGLNLTLDLLISEKFDPEALLRKGNGLPSVNREEMKHGDFLGNYICYYFDQSKAVYSEDSDEPRALRYGVVSIYDTYESLTGEMSIRAHAMFFDQKDYQNAIDLKTELDSIFSSQANLSVNSRNVAIDDAFSRADNPQRREDSSVTEAREVDSAYEGDVIITDHHAFINLQSNAYGDHASIVLYAPQKKSSDDYIGGMGSVSSISRGREHRPVAHKIILSKYALGCSTEAIAEDLDMLSDAIEMGEEIQELCEFCSNLYSDKGVAERFDEADKKAMIQRRLQQLVENYVKKNISCVASVSDKEDGIVYKHIKKYGDPNWGCKYETM